MIADRVDTVAGTLHVEDPDGIDSVWVTLETTARGYDGGFNRVFDGTYRFVVQGFQPTEQIPLVFRARDISGFEVQRDTYVVVLP